VLSRSLEDHRADSIRLVGEPTADYQIGDVGNLLFTHKLEPNARTARAPLEVIEATADA